MVKQATAYLGKRRKLSAALIAVPVIIILMVAFTGGGDRRITDDQLFFTVKRGPLDITINETGAIESRDRTIVRPEIRRNTTIAWIIEEGSTVKKGDLLCRLNDQEFVKQKENLELEVINSESEVDRVSTDVKIAINDALAQVSDAEVAFINAQTELEKYKLGTYPQELRKRETDISIAEEELQRSKDKLSWSEKLHEEGYITRSELQADQLAMKRQEIKLELARSAMEIFEKYEHTQQLRKLEIAVDNKELALESQKQKAESRKKLAERNLTNYQMRLTRHQEQLEDVIKDVEGCMIYSPVDAMVIYSTTVRNDWWYRETLAEGREIDEDMQLFYLPSSSGRNAKIKIHETELELVEPGMRTRITVDAFPNSEYSGVVSDIAVMPSKSSYRQSPDVKLFDAEIEIDGDAGILRPGMSCRVEVIIHVYPDVHYIPVQAVVMRSGTPYVYIKDDGNLEMKPIKLGLSGNEFAAVLDGLTVGDSVLLTPPLEPVDKKEEAADETPAAEADNQVVAAQS